MSIKDVLQGKPLGHPSHPMFVHFPTALFPTSLLFDLLSWVFTQPELVKAAFFNIAVGLAAGLLAVLTGFVDYFTARARQRDRGAGPRHYETIVCVG